MKSRLLVIAAVCLVLLALLPLGVAQATEVCHPWGTATIEDSGTFSGTGGADIIVGSSGADIISAGDGDDIICGRGGNDTIYGEDGNDIIYGEDDNDTLEGGDGDDTFYYADQWGEDGDDTLSPGSGTDVIYMYEKRSRAAVNIDTTDHTTYEDETDEEIPAGTVVVRYSAGTDPEDTDTIEFADAGDVVEVALLPGYYGDVENGDNFFWGDSTTPRTDQVVGSRDSDHIFGYGGDDFLWGDDPTGGAPPGDYWADDEIDGGAGSYNEIQGGWGDDLLTGGSGVDWMWANEGHDRVIGNGGDDYLVGGWIVPWQDDDTATNGDILDGGSGADEIWGGNYQNYVMDDDEDVAIDFGDQILGGDDGDTIDGGPGDDVVEGGNGNDTLDGDTGTNTISYEHASSAITFDLATTSSQNTGGAGSDTQSNFLNIIGSDNADTLTGNSSNNVIEGLDDVGGDDTLEGSDGTDTVSYRSAETGVDVDLDVTTAQVTGGAGTDTLEHDFEIAWGSDSDDDLNGRNLMTDQLWRFLGDDDLRDSTGNDVAYGGGGNDTYHSHAGTNSFYGGDGTFDGSNEATGDTADYQVAAGSGSITADLDAGSGYGTASRASQFSDTLYDTENLVGDGTADTLTGSGAANYIAGMNGADIINGDSGGDRIRGGSGNDSSYGDGDNDTFVYEQNADDFMDGGAGSDTLNGEALTGALILDLNDGFSGTCSSGMDIDSAAGFDTCVANTTTNDSSIENLVGASGNDRLVGDVDVNTLEGRGGNEWNGSTNCSTATGTAKVLIGNAGNDTLLGGTGGDLLCGGDNDDTLYHSSTSSPVSNDSGTDSLDGQANTNTCYSYISSPNIDTRASCTTDNNNTNY